MTLPTTTTVPTPARQASPAKRQARSPGTDAQKKYQYKLNAMERKVTDPILFRRIRGNNDDRFDLMK